jgi:hypothetical protein
MVMSPSYARFAGYAALGSAASGFLYAVAFIIVARTSPARGATLAGLFLLTGGILATAVMVALYDTLGEVDQSFATWALLLGVVAALGSAAHGGYDLANGINPPGTGTGGLPSQVDPRGLLTFGVTGIAVAVFAWLVSRSRELPTRLAYVGYLSALLLEVLYLGRLVILDAKNPVIVVAALLGGFIVNPAWYAWLGVSLLRRSQAPA